MPSTNWLPWGRKILVVSLAFAGAVAVTAGTAAWRTPTVIRIPISTMIRVLRLTKSSVSYH